MSRLYDEIMENIQLTPETREQILRHVSERERERKAKVQNMKKWTKYLSVAACCAIVLGAAYGIHTVYLNKTADKEETILWEDPVNDSQISEDQTQIANPMKEYSSAAELSDAVGFTIKEIGELPFAVNETQYFSYDDTLAEIRYTGENQEVYFRKSQGDEDNSGVYNTYSQETTIPVGDVEITCKGENDAYELAIWQKDGYSCSISLETGISLEELQAMIEQVEA